MRSRKNQEQEERKRKSRSQALGNVSTGRRGAGPAEHSEPRGTAVGPPSTRCQHPATHTAFGVIGKLAPASRGLSWALQRGSHDAQIPLRFSLVRCEGH